MTFGTTASLVAILLSSSLAPTVQPAAGPAFQESAPVGGAAPSSPQPVDLTDLLRRIFRDDPPPAPQPPVAGRMQTIAPVIGAKPTFGVIAGVAGNVAFYRGDPATTSISSSVVSMTVSTEQQAGLSAHGTVFGRDDRWRLEADYRFQWTSQPTYGLGMATAAPTDERIRFDFYRLHQAAAYRLRPGLFVGGGLHFDNHTDVRPEEGREDAWPDSPYVQYSTANGLQVETQRSAGPSVEITWDSRDNFINPRGGSLARASYRTMFEGFLGGDTRWDKVNLDLRTFRRLSATGRHTIAAWGYADLVTSGVAPYFDLPSTGNDTYGRSGRGYAEGHFRGEKLAFLEVEYRGTLTRNGLLGWVAFVNATTVSNEQAGERIFDHVAPGGGAGLRLLLNKRSRTNLAFDIGFGEKGNRGVYLGVQEAF
jgi:outer membrane protein assembly factor BamA